MKRLVLCILDGFGEAPLTQDNPLSQAVYWRGMRERYPMALLKACGEAVGLPKGQIGNSEVGHTTIGLGRVQYQNLTFLNNLFATKEFWSLPSVESFLKKLDSPLHLFGLLSDGGVHSHQNHLLSILEHLKKASFSVCLHLCLDGRDTGPKSCLKSLEELAHCLTPNIQISTLMGRYYGMDRDLRWDRTEKAYHAIAQGLSACPPFQEPQELIEEFYSDGITDEFIPPCIFKGYQGIAQEDNLWIFNFRPDRVRQIIRALCFPEFQEFKRTVYFSKGKALGMCSYGNDSDPYLSTALPCQSPKDSLGEVISSLGYRQLRIGETEKYAHVTYFFNGGREEPFPGEDRILIPSPKVATYDLCPEMSSDIITDAVLKGLQQAYQLIVVNYASPDMIGHTGDSEAISKTVQSIDIQLKKLEEGCLSQGWDLIITADHGNIECPLDGQGNIQTAHSLSPVPFLLVSKEKIKLRIEGKLSDIAPTILDILQHPKPEDMTGRSLCLK